MVVKAALPQDDGAADLQRVRQRGYIGGTLLLGQGGQRHVEYALARAQQWTESAPPESAEAARRAAYTFGLRDALSEPVPARE